MTVLLDIVAEHRRKMWTGSAAVFVHGLTDEELESIGSDPGAFAYERDPDMPHTYSAGSIERAAVAELAWRRSSRVSFGWHSRD